MSRRKTSLARIGVVALAGLALTASVAPAQGDAEDLAKKLANPVSSLYSVPLQANYDSGFGADAGDIWRINIQPVLPFGLGPDWNLISRTILPIVIQDDVPVAGAGETGTGDLLQSLFFSPAQPTAGGWTWGMGPALLFPTASDDALGGERWAAGPTGVALRQSGPWTYGMLANHLWSYAGEDDRADVNATFLQPFVAYITSTKTTFTVNTESTYDWDGDAWSVPINVIVAQLFEAGIPMQIAGGARYWAESPRGAADGWGARVILTLLFPR